MKKTSRKNSLSWKWLFIVIIFVLIRNSCEDSSFYWIDDSFHIDSGGDITKYNCNTSDCIKFACTQTPSVPYCKQCSKIESSDAYSRTPVDCDSDQLCSTCLGTCKDWATDWTSILPVPGASGSGFNYRESHVCTSGANKGTLCSGGCVPSYHSNCSFSVTDDAECNCKAGMYVCIGEEIDISKACDPTVCDPSDRNFDPSECSCKSGVCQFIPGPAVNRVMGSAITNTRCHGYNQDSNVAGSITLSCTDPKCTISRNMYSCPSCITTTTSPATAALKECTQACLLDTYCVAITFDDQSAKNRSSICYKSLDCTTEASSSSTMSVLYKDLTWMFPSECLPRLQLTEDFHNNPNVGFTHTDPTCQSATVSVLLNVKFGQLNFGLPDISYDCLDPKYDPVVDGNPARAGICQNYAGGFKSAFVQGCPTWPSDTVGRYCSGLDGSILTPAAKGAKISLLKSIADVTQVTYPGAKLTGPYQAVRAAMRNLTYLPPDDQNTNRLRSRIYSVQSSRALLWPLTKPYEELTLTVKFDDGFESCNPNGQKFPRAQVHKIMLKCFLTI